MIYVRGEKPNQKRTVENNELYGLFYGKLRALFRTIEKLSRLPNGYTDQEHVILQFVS